MSNWQMFRRSLANHPGITVGWMWAALVALALLSRADAIPAVIWLTVYPALASMAWLPILCTAWGSRKQYADERSEKE